MVSHRGATRKKKVPEPKIVEEPPLVANCICCHCEAVFGPFDVVGGYLDRRCPSCGGSLAESEYDAAHRAVSADIDLITAQIGEAEKKIAKKNAWARRFKWAAFAPLRRLFEGKARVISDMRVKLKERCAAKRNRLGALARSRYYAGGVVSTHARTVATQGCRSIQDFSVLWP